MAPPTFQILMRVNIKKKTTWWPRETCYDFRGNEWIPAAGEDRKGNETEEGTPYQLKRTEVAFSLFSNINQSVCSLLTESWTTNQILTEWCIVHASLGISNTIEDNSDVNMPSSFFITVFFFFYINTNLPAQSNVIVHLDSSLWARSWIDLMEDLISLMQ